VSDSFVVDASIAIGWVHPAQSSKDSQASLSAMENGALAYAPSIWPLEVANALLTLDRRGKLNREDRLEALDRLSKLPVTLDHDGVNTAFTKLSENAALYGLSVYDAAYLELAQRKGLPIACKDGLLRNAALKAGVVIWAANTA
jgi:predicted nucleic acid-binding protein